MIRSIRLPASGRKLAILGLGIALVLGAGCTALPFVSDGSGASAYTAPGEPLDGTTLAQEHVDALGAAGSVTINETRTVTYDGLGSERYRNVTKFDLDSGEAIRHRSGPAAGNDGLAERHVYDNGSVAFVNETRLNNNGFYTHYFRIDSPASEPGFGALDLSTYDGLAQRIDALEWNQQGTERLDRAGVTVTRYTATMSNATNAVALASAYGLSSVAELERFEATLLVSNDGVVRRQTVAVDRTIETLDGDTINVTERRTVRIENLGDTEIDEPEWTSRT